MYSEVATVKIIWTIYMNLTQTLYNGESLELMVVDHHLEQTIAHLSSNKTSTFLVDGMAQNALMICMC